jgi:poly(ADP-ribose) glycohydrolase ARH3
MIRASCFSDLHDFRSTWWFFRSSPDILCLFRPGHRPFRPIFTLHSFLAVNTLARPDSFSPSAFQRFHLMNTSAITEKRFLGSLLGLMLGDALGAPCEGLSAEIIYRQGLVNHLLANEENRRLEYTDDTQMMIGILETLLEKEKIDPRFLIERFVKNYDPYRGYGAGVRKILRAFKKGESPETVVRSVFPDGSYGNGAAMRVAPVGLAFCEDLHQVATEATTSACVTHVHHLGVEGARLLALAVALAVRTQRFDRSAFLGELAEWSEHEEYRWQLETARSIDQDVPMTFGSGVEAHRSVVTAIQLFADYPDDFCMVIRQAIGLGDDTDTVAAMAGAISGARLGIDAIPDHLLGALEDDPTHGRRHVEQMGRDLFARWEEGKFRRRRSWFSRLRRPVGRKRTPFH